MFTESAELYDLIYSTFKDYRAESEAVARLIAGVAPGARTVLDVGCGTGEHARILSREHGLRVDGLDLDEALLARARHKHPGGRFFHGDMSSFDLGERYDVVMTLFSGIGYLRTLERVTAALECFRRHLSPGGCVIVEPWLSPDTWIPGRVATQLASGDGVEVFRMSHADARGGLSILTFDYLVGTAGGVEHRHEVHEMGLFTPEEMLACFARAGLAAELDPVGLTGRGLYVAREARS